MTLPDPAEERAPRRLRVVETAKAQPSAPELPPHYLPLALSTFIGREREIADVKRLIGEDRLLTLTGPGGSGKTRLALAVASEVMEGFEDGVWWVGLASLSDPALISQAVAQVLEVREQPGFSLTDTLAYSLREKRLLLILDNCEHLIEACAALADTLLRSCRNLKILATSREALGIAGERAWVVPPLSVPYLERLPDLEHLAQYESIRLFVDRARSVVSGFELTERNAPALARVCQKLDGIPLAIELAAVKVRALSVEQISERLENPLRLLSAGSRRGDPRHQTLRATLNWSYDLLSEPERVLFRRLSVFAGGWDLGAAEAVGAAGDIDAEEVLDLLCRLVDQSLVVAEAGMAEGAHRYRMLEPVRQYALELLEESGEADKVRGRHAALFTALAEQSHSELRGHDQVEWTYRLIQENDNLRAAIAWALSAGETETAARLVSPLWGFWWCRGNHREGRRLAEAALESGRDLAPELRIRATVSAEVMAYGQGDNEAVLRYAGELSELSHQVARDAYAEAYVNSGLGLVAMNRGDLQEATARLEEALPLCLASGEVWTAAQAHTWLGTVLLLQGDHDLAVRRFEDGLALARQIGDRTGIYNALYALAQVALAQGEHERAMRSFEEGMILSAEMRDWSNVAYCLEGLATVAGVRGEAEHSIRLFGAARGLFESIGVPVWTFYKPDRVLYERTLADLRTRLGEAIFEAAEAEGRAMTPEQAIEYALDHGRHGRMLPAPSTPPQEEGASATPTAPPAGLSEREVEVLKLLAEGLTNAQVADRLYLSPRTVHRHLNSIYHKLGTNSRAAAARFAVEHSLV